MAYYTIKCSMGKARAPYTERFREADNARIFVETVLGEDKISWSSPTCISARKGNLTIECPQLKEVMDSDGDGQPLHLDTRNNIKLFLGDISAVEETTSKTKKTKATPPPAKPTAKAEAAPKATAPKTTATPAASKTNGVQRPKGGFKATDIVELMRSKPNGVTREEVLALTGWKAVSMQAQAAAAGVELDTDTSQRPYRYKVKS